MTLRRVPAAEIVRQTMPVLDVRRHPTSEQIRGALRYDAAALLAVSPLLLPLDHDRAVALYADDESKASAIAERLLEEGYAGACILEGGFEAYQAAGLPTEPITQEQPVPGTEAGIPRS